MPNPLRRFASAPTHPATVHFPLALFPAALVFDGLAWWDGGSGYTQGAFVLMVLGLAGAAVAATTGFAQLLDVVPDSPAWRLTIVHLSVQLAAVSILVVGLLLRVNDRDLSHPSVAATAVSAAGTLALLVGAWFGGHLVFKHAVGVESSPSAPPDEPALPAS
jgi:uncharacterized membrane protein